MLVRKLTAEGLGTALLLATVVGSGIMAESLTQDVALALLGNTLATGAMLIVLITTLGPVSGAHFNPAVTVAMLLRKEISLTLAGTYILAQLLGAILGTWGAHAMFEQDILQTSLRERTGSAQWLSESIATFGLVFFIFAGLRFKADAIPWIVGLYITAAYWFTASTSFANPAVTLARSVTNTFSGIQPIDAPAFIVAQMIGAVLATLLASWLFHKER